MPDETMWLMASYHMPSTYSIRVPVSSPLCGKALPAPGPATVQLAMIRTAIELYGLEATRDELFPRIVECNPQIQPPNRVAISSQMQRLLKADDGGRLNIGIGYREFCHCEGFIRIFVQTPRNLSVAFTAILRMIGYWGRSDGFACCSEVAGRQPDIGRCARKFEELSSKTGLNNYFCAYATEFIRPDICWAEVVPPDDLACKPHVRPQLYVWPLVTCEHQSTSQVMRFRSLDQE